MARAPLAGRGIVVTRPEAQAAGLTARLAAAGATPLCFPALAILPPADPAPAHAVMAELARFDLALFVSPTAVARAFASLRAAGLSAWPAHLAAAAVGEGTARELRAHGVARVLAPADGADSEHLLALPELQAVAGRRIALFRGEGGRELLAEQLAARGARVVAAPCYRRGPPARFARGPLLDAVAQGRVHALTVFSAQTLDNLFSLIGAPAWGWLRDTPLFAPHPRIAAHAESRGARRAIATPPGESGLVRGLVEYFTHDHARA